MKTYQTIRFEKKENIGYLTLNRPDVRNAISQEMIDEILDLLARIDRDAEIRVLIVTGAGKAFMAGADISELKKMKPMDVLRWNEGVVRINQGLEKLRQPVIAAINGPAMGGGMEMAISCTFRIMARSAKMALPEVKLGIIPGTGGTQRLPRLIGKGRAAEILLTGEIIDAETALKIGLVNQVADDGGVVEAAEKLAARIIVNAPVAVELTKDALEIGKDLPLEQAVQYSQKNCITCFSTEDMQEGMSAFLEKRKPVFMGK
ncbi:enoyl-CoA hydratase/isomerase family protein [Desulfatirhabdium butyrativorans]|uniref:enoyl-CoA hydratase/isomerase family protein n=1 Tax=Desulfatirhabdium butyrativorans TaxID=340467 RepID=UPI0003FE0A52|nr:enoyl-CoA hydratase/isomerase family protein [Desulfatirhabdium butyrativorans]